MNAVLRQARAAVLLLGLLGLPAAALADTIDFNAHPGTGNWYDTQVTYAGYCFVTTVNSLHIHIIDTTGGGTWLADNDSDLALDTWLQPNETLRMTNLTGSVFDLIRFDASKLMAVDAEGYTSGHGVAKSIHVVGTRADGTQVTAGFELAAMTGFSASSLAEDFRSLSAVGFWAEGVWVDGSPHRPSFAIDNIEVSTVPEPASLLLLGTGLVGVVRTAWHGCGSSRPTSTVSTRSARSPACGGRALSVFAHNPRGNASQQARVARNRPGVFREPPVPVHARVPPPRYCPGIGS